MNYKYKVFNKAVELCMRYGWFRAAQQLRMHRMQMFLLIDPATSALTFAEDAARITGEYQD